MSLVVVEGCGGDDFLNLSLSNVLLGFLLKDLWVC